MRVEVARLRREVLTAGLCGDKLYEALRELIHRYESDLSKGCFYLALERLNDSLMTRLWNEEIPWGYRKLVINSCRRKGRGRLAHELCVQEHLAARSNEDSLIVMLRWGEYFESDYVVQWFNEFPFDTNLRYMFLNRVPISFFHDYIDEVIKRVLEPIRVLREDVRLWELLKLMRVYEIESDLLMDFFVRWDLEWTRHEKSLNPTDPNKVKRGCDVKGSSVQTPFLFPVHKKSYTTLLERYLEQVRENNYSFESKLTGKELSRVLSYDVLRRMELLNQLDLVKHGDLMRVPLQPWIYHSEEFDQLMRQRCIPELKESWREKQREIIRTQCKNKLDPYLHVIKESKSVVIRGPEDQIIASVTRQDRDDTAAVKVVARLMREVKNTHAIETGQLDWTPQALHTPSLVLLPAALRRTLYLEFVKGTLLDRIIKKDQLGMTTVRSNNEVYTNGSVWRSFPALPALQKKYGTLPIQSSSFVAVWINEIMGMDEDPNNPVAVEVVQQFGADGVKSRLESMRRDCTMQSSGLPRYMKERRLHDLQTRTPASWKRLAWRARTPSCFRWSCLAPKNGGCIGGVRIAQLFTLTDEFASRYVHANASSGAERLRGLNHEVRNGHDFLLANVAAEICFFVQCKNRFNRGSEGNLDSILEQLQNMGNPKLLDAPEFEMTTAYPKTVKYPAELGDDPECIYPFSMKHRIRFHAHGRTAGIPWESISPIPVPRLVAVHDRAHEMARIPQEFNSNIPEPRVVAGDDHAQGTARKPVVRLIAGGDHAYGTASIPREFNPISPIPEPRVVAGDDRAHGTARKPAVRLIAGGDCAHGTARKPVVRLIAGGDHAHGTVCIPREFNPISPIPEPRVVAGDDRAHGTAPRFLANDPAPGTAGAPIPRLVVVHEDEEARKLDSTEIYLGVDPGRVAAFGRPKFKGKLVSVSVPYKTIREWIYGLVAVHSSEVDTRISSMQWCDRSFSRSLPCAVMARILTGAGPFGNVKVAESADSLRDEISMLKRLIEPRFREAKLEVCHWYRPANQSPEASRRGWNCDWQNVGDRYYRQPEIADLMISLITRVKAGASLSLVSLFRKHGVPAIPDHELLHQMMRCGVTFKQYESSDRSTVLETMLGLPDDDSTRERVLRLKMELNDRLVNKVNEGCRLKIRATPRRLSERGFCFACADLCWFTLTGSNIQNGYCYRRMFYIGCSETNKIYPERLAKAYRDKDAWLTSHDDLKNCVIPGTDIATDIELPKAIQRKDFELCARVLMVFTKEAADADTKISKDVRLSAPYMTFNQCLALFRLAQRTYESAWLMASRIGRYVEIFEHLREHVGEQENVPFALLAVFRLIPYVPDDMVRTLLLECNALLCRSQKAILQCRIRLGDDLCGIRGPSNTQNEPQTNMPSAGANAAGEITGVEVKEMKRGPLLRVGFRGVDKLMGATIFTVDPSLFSMLCGMHGPQLDDPRIYRAFQSCVFDSQREEALKKLTAPDRKALMTGSRAKRKGVADERGIVRRIKSDFMVSRLDEASLPVFCDYIEKAASDAPVTIPKVFRAPDTPCDCCLLRVLNSRCEVTEETRSHYYKMLVGKSNSNFVFRILQIADICPSTALHTKLEGLRLGEM